MKKPALSPDKILGKTEVFCPDEQVVLKYLRIIVPILIIDSIQARS